MKDGEPQASSLKRLMMLMSASFLVVFVQVMAVSKSGIFLGSNIIVSSLIGLDRLVYEVSYVSDISK